jgi:hypothetical protein
MTSKISKVSKDGRPSAYDRGQHMLVCQDLGVSRFANAPGPSAHEAVQELQQHRVRDNHELFDISLDLETCGTLTSNLQLSEVLRRLAHRLQAMIRP